MDFGGIFLKLRNELGLKQDEIAKKLGVSKSTIGMWETGKRLPSPELYEQVADFFNVDIDYLYGRSSVRQLVHYDKDGTAYVPAGQGMVESMTALRSDECELLEYYNQLNDIGQAKAMSDISDMTELSKYRKDTVLKNA